jgi:hypothetical protein
MVGNDIVDLTGAAASPDARHPRFDLRVFAAAELELLASSPSPEEFRWILWSAKESAYKAARRRCARTVFSPPRFVVRLDSTLRGFVAHGQNLYSVDVQWTGPCLHAVASDPAETAKPVSAARRLEAEWLTDPSRGARELAIEAIAPRLGVSPDRLRIDRVDRMPRLLLDDRTLPAPLSLSHHGSFVGFACQLGAISERIH